MALSPSRIGGHSRKGQYFSFDAIIASVIFILGLSLLTSHWFALRAQIDSSSDYLGQDAMRMSDLLLGTGNPINYSADPTSWGNWYHYPSTATRAGFAINNSPNVLLNATQLYMAQGYVGKDVSLNPAFYNDYRSLLSTGAQFLVVVNTTDHNQLCPGYTQYGKLENFTFGLTPVNPSEIAEVHRSIALLDPCAVAPATQYYYGTLTLYVWTNQSGP